LIGVLPCWRVPCFARFHGGAAIGCFFHDLSVSIALSVAPSVAEAVDRCGIKGYWEW
jgi:hypothetical protein